MRRSYSPAAKASKDDRGNPRLPRRNPALLEPWIAPDITPVYGAVTTTTLDICDMFLATSKAATA